MRYSLVFLILVVIVFSSEALAQIPSKKIPAGVLKNGQHWLTLDDQGKQGFLDGLQAALKSFEKSHSAAASSKPSADTITYAWTDIAMELDTMYADGTNTGIPIVFAYDYAVKKLSGEKANTLARILSSMRESWKPGH